MAKLLGGFSWQDSLQQSLAMMPQNALVGFITFGAMQGPQRGRPPLGSFCGGSGEMGRCWGDFYRYDMIIYDL